MKRPLSRPANLQKYRDKPELLMDKSGAELRALLLQPEFSEDQGKKRSGFPKHDPTYGGVESRSLLKKRGEKIPPVRPIPTKMPRNKRKLQDI